MHIRMLQKSEIWNRIPIQTCLQILITVRIVGGFGCHVKIWPDNELARTLTAFHALTLSFLLTCHTFFTM